MIQLHRKDNGPIPHQRQDVGHREEHEEEDLNLSRAGKTQEYEFSHRVDSRHIHGVLRGGEEKMAVTKMTLLSNLQEYFLLEICKSLRLCYCIK